MPGRRSQPVYSAQTSLSARSSPKGGRVFFYVAPAVTIGRRAVYRVCAEFDLRGVASADDFGAAQTNATELPPHNVSLFSLYIKLWRYRLAKWRTALHRILAKIVSK